MNILLTGGAGYLGSVACSEFVRRGWKVRSVDNLMYGQPVAQTTNPQPGVEFIYGDMTDASLIDRALRGIDSVVHLAAIVGDPACSRNPELARRVNLDASMQLIRMARERFVGRFLFASTCSNYGNMGDTTTLATEDHELRPVSLYAETKVAIEKELLTSPGSRMVPIICRFATLYGLSSRMRFDLTVNEFVLKMVINRELVVYGEQFWRPYVHVRDAAAAIGMLLAAPPEAVVERVFNVGDTAENYRKSDLIRIIEQSAGPARIHFVTQRDDPRNYRVSFERIRSAVGFSIQRRVPNGVDEIARAIESGTLLDYADAYHYNCMPQG